MMAMKSAYPTSQFAATYRSMPGHDRQWLTSPTESEFSESFDNPPESTNVLAWSEDRVAEWLRSVNLSQYIELFSGHNVNGQVFVELDRPSLRDMGVKKVGDQIRIANSAARFRNSGSKTKSKARKNRESLAQLDQPQYTPPSSASPKPPASRFASRDPSKRLSRHMDYHTVVQSTVAKTSSRPSSPYIEQQMARGDRARYPGQSPSKDLQAQSMTYSVRTPQTSSENISISTRYGGGERSGSYPTPIETPMTARFPTGHSRGLSADNTSTNSILPTDKPILRVIYDQGRTHVFDISKCKTTEDVMYLTLRKGGLNEQHVKSYCFCVLDGTEPNPALCRRINDIEVMRICSDKTRGERNRLILRKIHQGDPDDEQLKTSASIAAQIQNQQVGAVIVPQNPKSRSKIETITGEPLPSVSYPQSPGTQREREIYLMSSKQDKERADRMSAAYRAARIKEHFGGRPPSELIASDLSTYFPDFEKDQIDKTVRMSVRRSRRISRAASRLSIASNYSVASSIRDAPPVPSLPNISDAWLRDQPKGLRPLSVLRLGNPGYRDSITSSVLEPLDEESPLDSDRKSYVSFGGNSDTIAVSDPDGSTTTMMQSYYDDGHSSIANSSLSGEGNDSLNKRLSQLVHDDSEESDEELQEYLESDSWDNIKYMKGALIGQGSFGSVYLALHAVSGELMAVKQVEMPSNTGTALDAKKNSMLDALKHEIGLLRELKHPNIVQYLGSNSDEVHLNIFLEYVAGGSVATMLVNYGPLGESLIANFVRQILTGLAYLHSQDIIHRDIKGANILVDNKGSVKISDFGISKRVEASSLLTGGSSKKAGNRVSLQGSVFWMAPEVVKQTAYTRKADIWSLGCLIIEMLTGHHPHPNCTQLQAIFKIGRGEDASPTIPENASQELRMFCLRTFENEHEKRPEAEELLKSPFVLGANSEDKKKKGN
jgi:mitogen-activated protein kinase kinase kinase